MRIRWTVGVGAVGRLAPGPGGKGRVALPHGRMLPDVGSTVTENRRETELGETCASRLRVFPAVRRRCGFVLNFNRFVPRSVVHKDYVGNRNYRITIIRKFANSLIYK